MRTLTKWLADRKAKAQVELQERGYDYAAGRLLRGCNEDELDAEIAAVDFNAFDLGMLQALREWQRQRAQSEPQPTDPAAKVA